MTGGIVLQPLVLHKRERTHLLILHYTPGYSEAKVTKYSLLFTYEMLHSQSFLTQQKSSTDKNVQNPEYEIIHIMLKKQSNKLLFGSQYDS